MKAVTRVVSSRVSYKLIASYVLHPDFLTPSQQTAWSRTSHRDPAESSHHQHHPRWQQAPPQIMWLRAWHVRKWQQDCLKLRHNNVDIGKMPHKADSGIIWSPIYDANDAYTAVTWSCNDCDDLSKRYPHNDGTKCTNNSHLKELTLASDSRVILDFNIKVLRSWHGMWILQATLFTGY